MEITKTFYPKDRNDFRKWLEENHDKEREIWLILPLKQSGKAKIPYDDSVEEALCFGWIDSTQKKIDEDHATQRFTPRKPKSPWSELNKERARKLIELDLMTPAGAKFLPNLNEEFVFSADILEIIRSNEVAYNNFMNFPEVYRRLRFGYIEDVRKNPIEFQKRLQNLIKMSEKNKMFGSQVSRIL